MLKAYESQQRSFDDGKTVSVFFVENGLDEPLFLKKDFDLEFDQELRKNIDSLFILDEKDNPIEVYSLASFYQIMLNQSDLTCDCSNKSFDILQKSFELYKQVVHLKCLKPTVAIVPHFVI